MSSSAQAPFPSDLASLAEAAWALDPVPPHERSGLLRPECAELLDQLPRPRRPRPAAGLRPPSGADAQRMRQ